MSIPQAPAGGIGLGAISQDRMAWWYAHEAGTYDVRGELRGIGIPALVFTSAHDWVCPPAGARRIAAEIPRARLVELNRSVRPCQTTGMRTVGSLALPTGGLVFALLGCTSPDGGPRPVTPTATDVPPAPTADTGTPTPQARIEVAGAPCIDPTLRSRGPAFTVTALPYDEATPWLEFDGAGVGIGDFDRDGLLDVLVLGHEREEYVAQGPPGVFVTLESGFRDPTIDLSSGFGAAVADYDADGDLDVFVSRYRMPNVLLQNDGTGYFVDMAPAHGLQGDPTHRSAGATWSDYDNDGDLDLYVAGHGPPFLYTDPEPPADPSYFYVNLGDGTFADRSDLFPERVHRGRTLVPLFLDLDGDGWRDLFMANDFFGTAEIECLLAWNRQGTFVLDDDQVGLDRPISAMGIGVGDLNDDGVWDLLVSAWARSELLTSSPSGVWVDYAAALGLVHATTRGQIVGWGDELADLDNDGDLDAVMAFGQVVPENNESPPAEPQGLWVQQPDGTFVDQAQAWGFISWEPSRGLGVTDLDRDGWLDVVLPSLVGPTRLYRATCGEDAWLEVALTQPGTRNPDAIGATVEVEVAGRTQRRPMLAGGTGYGTGLPPIVHFGLGEHETVDRMTVRWPDGVVSVIEAVAVRQIVTVERR